MKRILAIVLSIAILVMAFPFGAFATTPNVATDTWDGTTVEPTTTDADGNIIINTAEELAWIALEGATATANKNYIVAKNSVFDMCGMENITLNSTSDDVIAATKTSNIWRSLSDTNSLAFQGNFDGNGLVVYNLYSYQWANAGLFPCVDPSTQGTITIKNVTVVASYMSAYHYAAGIVGLGNASAGTGKNLVFDKCTVKNSYMDDMGKGVGHQRTVATIVASLSHNGTTINNCLAIDNKLSSTGVVGGLFANTSNFGDNVAVSNSISIGTNVDITAVEITLGSKVANTTYTNVYTDKATELTGVYTLTTDKMQGDAAKANMALAWNIDWLAGEEGEYPSINYGDPIKDPYVWDGTFEEPTEIDADGNIIINSVQEMAWVALRGDTATDGKNYKVADGIEYFDMNGAVGITADSTAAEVQAATATGNNWNYAADSKVGKFMGNFDGNGVTIYNIRTKKQGYAALFPFIYNNSTIENVIVKASYFAGYHYAAGIVGLLELQKTVNINKCTVENCYMTDAGDTNTLCTRATAQFVAGTGNSDLNISNCFAANNTLSSAGFEAGFVATTGAWQPTGTSIKNSISIGITPYSNAKIGELGKGLTEKLTVENVYSDVACDVAGFTALTTEQMQGDAAKANMALAWNIDWLAGEEGEYPSINYGDPIKDPYVWDGAFEEPTETDADGNIIINNVQEMAWVALRGDTATEGKNYKVADGIEYFDMNGAVGITADSTAAEVKAATATGNNWSYAADGKVGKFMGNFDGNGVTIYNIRTKSFAYGALFPFVYNDCTIENVKVKASFIVGYHYAAGIVATSELQSKTVNINKCAVENCYISDNGNINAACRRAAAGILAGTGNSNVNISNSAVYNNDISATCYEAAFIAQSGDYIAWNGGLSIVNSVAVGVTPYSNSKLDESIGKGLTEKLTVENVYSDIACDVEGYITLANDKMQGAVASVTMDKLDTSVWFFNTTTYPDLYVFHNIVDGKCDCGLEVAGDPCAGGHTLVAVEGYDATNFTDGLLDHDKCSVCEKTFIDGVEKTAEELVIPMLAKKWDGTFTEPTETDADGNIIINTPSELAWLALRGGTATAGKNYVVAKDSVFNLNGMEGITPFSTTADVKAATKNDACKWQFASDSTGDSPFSGNFDGNGLIVYNLYTGKGRGFGGLFPVLMNQDGESATIKNVTLLSSHIGGYHWTGGIIGYMNSESTNSKLNLENIVVKNCFIYDNDDTNTACQRTTGVLVGQLLHTSSTINNCLVVDNELSAQGIIGGLFGNTSAYGDGNTVKNVISIGTSVQSVMVNYAINSKPVTYINVYTDQLASADGITTLTLDQMKGAAASDNMNLNWGINWAVGAEGEYPSIIIDNAFYDEWDGTFAEPTKTDVEGNIIISTAEEMAWIALRGDTATAGKNYKVADGIKYFNMNGMIGITPNSTVEDVKNATTDATKAWNFAAEGKVGTFYGNFDGNGVTIYNIATKSGQGYGGLFPVVKPESSGALTIKNVAVVASFVGGYHNAGAIVGLADAPDASTSLVLENIIVKNSYIYDNNDANSACQRTVGVLAGNVTHNSTTINNCFVEGNELSAQGIVGGLFGNASAYVATLNVSNVISIGTKIEPTSINYAISDKVAATVYTNVYTDQATDLDGITTLTVEEMSGASIALDWSAWFATTALPELRAFHNVTSVDNGDGTHTDTCNDCNIITVATNHVFVDGACAVCGAACSHVAGDAVQENVIPATCATEGSYDLVVKCTLCGEEISRETFAIEINPNAHVYDDDADPDCNACGAVRSEPVSYGDINGDGAINNKDLGLLMQYINGWVVTVDVAAADVNADGAINNKDYGLLMQYINGWQVVLGPKV